MNIHIVKQNIKQTIYGKELYLNSLDPHEPGYEVLKQFLELNITELNNILSDVEKCIDPMNSAPEVN